MPNPEDDEVVAVFYSVQDSDRDANDDGSVRSGVIVVQTDQLNGRRVRNLKAEFVESELELLNRFIDVVVEIDPDILSGWEVQAASWGYLNARGRAYGNVF